MAGRRPSRRGGSGGGSGRGGSGGGSGRGGDGWWPPKSVPIAVEGGLQARSQRGRIGDTWWSQRFLAVLESFGMGSRLQRGKRYARTGQVLTMEVGPGEVKASVQGSRSRPYRVFVETDVLTPDEWDDVEAVMASRAVFTASLLAGEMPEEIEEAFAATASSLFPTTGSEFESACSCPDWENPCKHIAAVFYLLAEAFDRDPFLIFAWRGRDKEALLASLRSRRRAAAGAGGVGGAGAAEGGAGEGGGGSVGSEGGAGERFGWPGARPVPESAGVAGASGVAGLTGAAEGAGPVPGSVWGEGTDLRPIDVRYRKAVAPDLVLRRLDPAPLGADGDRILEVLRRSYEGITAAAASLAMGGPEGPDGKPGPPER